MNRPQHVRKVIYTVFMELPPLNNSTSASPTRSTNASSLLDTAQLAAGSKLTATVESISVISPKMRAQLLAYYTSDSSPADSHHLASAQKKLTDVLSKPEIFAVQLSALGKRVLTFTELALPLKHKIPVFIRPDGQLQINAAALAKSAAGQLLAVNMRADGAAPGTPGEHNTAHHTINEGLRRYLPLQTQLSQALQQLKPMETKVATELRHLGTLNSRSNPSPPVAQLRNLLLRIHTLTNSAASIESLTQPLQLKHRIMNSGVFFESKLASHIPAPSTVINGRTTAMGSPAQAPPQSLKDDLKAELLSLINAIAKLPSPSSSHGAKSTGSIDKLLQALFSASQVPGTAAAPDTASAAVATSRQALPALIAALARISSLQIRHLSQAQQELSTQPNGALLELPVRIGDHVYPLSLHIQETTVAQKQPDEDAKKSVKKGLDRDKKWHVFMVFDLEEYGAFASEIDVQDHRVSSRLWVQKEALWSTSKQHLAQLQDDLEKAGVVVEQLSCHHGTAPEKKTQLRQSLVDVRT